MNLSKDRKQLFSRDMILLISGLIIFSAAGVLNFSTKLPELELSKQETALNINKDVLIFMSAGNKRLMTDLLWVQTLIESDVEHYKKRDLNSWLFLRFNTIATLDKYFYENYLYGGQFLAIVKDDLEGANEIYRKGLEVYPNDFSLNFNAGFLNYYELGNFKDGLQLLEKIIDHPRTPYFVRSIINKLRVATGMGLKEVFQFVLHNYESTKDEALKSKLRKDLYAIKAEIDLTCLNNNGKGCGSKDLEGNDYQFIDSQYYSAKKFLPYRINQRRGESLQPIRLQEVNTFK